jgi:hypothetical protein
VVQDNHSGCHCLARQTTPMDEKMIEEILALLVPIANIIEKDVPGFAQRTLQQINELRNQYETELAKPSDQINDGLLDSYDFQLRELIKLCSSSLQPANAQTQS